MRVKKYTHAAFTADVLALAKLRGWLRASFRPARTKTGWRTAVSGDGVGFPDILLLRGAVVLVAELKIPPDRLRPEQACWLSAWREAGAVVRVWVPADWPAIERLLEKKP